MKPAIAKKWIEALRSGKYKQTKGTLKDETGFCCLGVLCDLHVKNEWGGLFEDRSFGRSTSLPPEIIEWAGMRTPIGDFSGTRDLTQCNDGDEGKRLSFKQIANIIEHNVDKL